MFKRKTHKTAVTLAIGMACLGAPSLCQAAQPIQFTGGLAGIVKNSTGIPQMGAAIQLFNRQDKLIGRVLTDERGEFRVLGLLPSVYSVRVSLATYVPVIKRDILVQPGMRSMLDISLSTIFSSIQLSYPTKDTVGIMSDDWKWVLRGSTQTRPVLRFVDGDDSTVDVSPNMETSSPVFSDTRAIVKLSAGDGSMLAGVATEADLGTAFALATSVNGKSLLQVSGNFGYGAATGAPAAAFRTSFSHNLMGGSPEISLTMRQLMMPTHAGLPTAGDPSLPLLRSMSASFDDSKQVAENVTLQYGFTMDMVSFLDHMNFYSPYARLRYEVAPGSIVEMAYSSGDPRPNLGGDASAEESDLQQDLNTLGLFPRMSLSGGRPQMQRGTEYELSFSHKSGSRIYQVSTYREHVSNLALSMVAPNGYFGYGDMLPDLFSGNSIFDIGTFANTGFTGAVTQNLGEHFAATMIVGSGGALTTVAHEVVSNSPDELRSMIRSGRRNAATAKVSAALPWTGTHLIASYQWTGDQRWAVPGNLYGTESFRPMPGLNLTIRQPIPGLGRRVEATADLRNLLAQGYLPLGTPDGQTILLVETPRTIRGGLSFIF